MSKVYGITDVGLVRQNNEDNYICKKIDDSFMYGIVCDGMGGAVGGERASKMACSVAENIINNGYREDMDETSLYRMIDLVIKNSNTAVYNESIENPDLKGMGTTLVMAICKNNRCYIASVGDSRAYLYRGDVLVQLTKDHSLVQELIDKNEITYEQALTHPAKNVITQAVGISDKVMPSYPECELQKDDIILLCSDGLTNMVSNEQIGILVDRIKNGENIELLTQKAKENGGKDNVTAVMLCV